MSRFLLILICVLPLTVSAQVRKYSNEFLAIGASARGMAMSNTINASVDDVTASYYNPAGLSKIKSNLQLDFMHSEYFGGLSSFDFAGIALRLSSKSAMSVSMIRFGADNIPNTFQLVDNNGIVDYSRVTEFSVADYAFLFSYGKRNNAHGYKKHEFRYGGTMKLIHRVVGSFAEAWGFGFDAGVQYDLDDQSVLSFGIRDASKTFNAWSFSFTDDQKRVLANTGNEIPVKSLEITQPRILANINHTFIFNEKMRVLAEGGLDITTDGHRNTLFAFDPLSFDPHIGAEAGYDKTIFLRAGFGQFQFYKSDKPGKTNKILGFQPCIGVGIKLKKIAFDYAFTDLGNASVGLYSHIIGVKLDISKKKGR